MTLAGSLWQYAEMDLGGILPEYRKGDRGPIGEDNTKTENISIEFKRLLHVANIDAWRHSAKCHHD
jgi:hypothetical protein